MVYLSDSSETSHLVQLTPRRGGGGKGGSKGGGKSSGGKTGSSGGSSNGGTGSGSSGSSSGTKSSSKAVPFAAGAGLGFGAAHSSASSFSSGGGPRTILSSGSPFSGREAGGGTRDGVFGTSRYGSGWPYGGYGSYVDSRPLPYYFYPVPFHDHYYGSHVYYNHNRPGGDVSTIPILSRDGTLQNQTYHLIGDRSSVLAVYTALRESSCSIQDTESQLATYDMDEPSRVVQPEQVVQWYRTSSFALSMDNYNNSASSLAQMPSNNDTSAPPPSADTPYPTGIDLQFLGCLNTTIGESIPLMDYTPQTALTAGAIAGIVVGAVFGIILFCVAGILCYRRRRKARSSAESGPRPTMVSEKAESKLPFARLFTRNRRGTYMSVGNPESAPRAEFPGAPERAESPIWSTTTPASRMPEPRHF